MAPASVCPSTLPDLATLPQEPVSSLHLPPRQQAFVKEHAAPFYRLELLENDADGIPIDAAERKEPLRTGVLASVLRPMDVQFFGTHNVGQNMLIGAMKVARAIARARRLLSKHDSTSRRRLRKRAAAAAVKPEDSIPIVATYELASLAQAPPPQYQPAASQYEQRDAVAAATAAAAAAAAACCSRRSTVVELFAGKKPPRRDSVLDLGLELATLRSPHDEHLHVPDCAVHAASQRS